MAITKPTTPNNAVQPHRVRTFFAALFGFFAVGMIIASIVIVWLNRTLTDTTQYVNTVAPLVQSKAVQDYVVDKTTDQLLNGSNVPLRDFAGQLLGRKAVVGQTEPQLRSEVKPVVESTVRQIVASPAFAKLWTDTNRQVHDSLMTQLNSDATIIHLNLHPLLSGIIDQLSGTRLAFVKRQLNIKPSDGQVTFEGAQLTNFRKGYHYFQELTWLIVLLTLVCVALCVWLSVHHGKTARRVAMATGIYAAVLCVLLSGATLINVGGGQDQSQQQLVKALFNGVTQDLRWALFAVAVLGVGGALASKFYSRWQAKRATK